MSEHQNPEDPDLERADALLERTRRFLTRCLEDPEYAFEDEDPEELRLGLYALTHPSDPPPPKLERLELDEEEPPSERRRSA